MRRVNRTSLYLLDFLFYVEVSKWFICKNIFNYNIKSNLDEMAYKPNSMFLALVILLSHSGNIIYSWDLSLKSPCKINLFLRVMGRRSTGYRKLTFCSRRKLVIFVILDDLASLFQAVSLSDQMQFSVLAKDASKDFMTCSDQTLEIDDRNLVIKAFNLMREKTGINQYFKVHLNKNVPIQAGLGGGSANAATAMHAFNVLCNFPGNHIDVFFV